MKKCTTELDIFFDSADIDREKMIISNMAQTDVKTKYLLVFFLEDKPGNEHRLYANTIHNQLEVLSSYP